MARLQRPLRPILISYSCDRCQGHELSCARDDSLKPTSQGYRHVCPGCGEVHYLDTTYPTIQYADEGGSIDLTDWTNRKYIT